MKYSMEELLPLTITLTEKYTSKESTSVPYETAQMLMNSVIYSIQEFEKSTSSLPAAKHISAEIAYQMGQDFLLEKIQKAKVLYDKLILDFYDYGCQNYHDTIIKGMPAFFLHYDYQFNPMNSILTLDYPTLKNYDNLQGIDLIYDYLSDVITEKKFLSCFPVSFIQEVLTDIEPFYTTNYMENLCYPVLEAVLERVMKQKPQVYFHGKSRETAEKIVRKQIKLICDNLNLETSSGYFKATAREYTLRWLC